MYQFMVLCLVFFKILDDGQEVKMFDLPCQSNKEIVDVEDGMIREEDKKRQKRWDERINKS